MFRRRSLRNTVALAAALLVLLLAASPAAAYRFKGSGFYGVLDGGTGSPSGLVVVDRAGNGQPHLHATFVGLLPYIEQEAVFRSIDCAGTPADDNRLFRAAGTSDANGDLTYDKVFSRRVQIGMVKSIWVDLGFPVCLPAVQFVRVAAGDVNGDGFLGLVKVGAGTLLLIGEARPNDQAQLSIVVNGFGGNDQLALRGVAANCGSPAPGSTTVVGQLVTSHFASTTVAMTQAQLASLHSLRVRNMTTGRNVGCVPLSIIAVLIG